MNNEEEYIYTFLTLAPDEVKKGQLHTPKASSLGKLY
jgi:hypothetical protein